MLSSFNPYKRTLTLTIKSNETKHSRPYLQIETKKKQQFFEIILLITCKGRSQWSQKINVV